MKKHRIEALKTILVHQDRLRKSLKPILEEIEAHDVFADRIRRFPDRYARGLVEAASDGDAELLEHNEGCRENLIQMLKEDYGIDYRREVIGVSKMAKKVIKRGRVRDNYEFRALVEFRDSLGDADAPDIEKANSLLYDYEKKKGAEL